MRDFQIILNALLSVLFSFLAIYLAFSGQVEAALLAVCASTLESIYGQIRWGKRLNSARSQGRETVH